MQTALAFWLILACGDIEAPDTVREHEPLVVRVVASEIPDGARLRGSFSATGGTYVQCGDDYHVWAPPGRVLLRARGVWILTRDVLVDGQTLPVLLDFGSYDYEKTVVVGGTPDPDPPPPPDPIVNPYRPAPRFQAAAQPVKAIRLEMADSRVLAEVYSSVAAQARAGVFSNMGKVRAEIVRLGTELNLRGKYTGLSPAVEAYLTTTLGLSTTVSAETVGDSLETLAWAVFEAGRQG